MSDWDSITADALHEEQELIKCHFINPEDFYSDEMIRSFESASLRQKINQQSPLVQKYWLGRLVYELAMRNEQVIDILNQVNNDKSLSHYIEEPYQTCSKYDRAKILSLEPYGFTPYVDKNRLFTEHTSYPAKLHHPTEGFININTIAQFRQLLDIIDGAPKKKYDLNNDSYKKWQKIGLYYTQNYLELTLLH